MSLHCIVDADSLIYRAGFATEYTQYSVTTEGDEILFQSKSKRELREFLEVQNEFIHDDVVEERIVEPLENALHILKLYLNSIKDKYNPTTIRILLTLDPNFRYEIYPKYKANRTQEKPVHYEAMVDYLLYNWGAEHWPGLEADDVAAIIANNMDEDYVVVGIDKDLDMIPGLHYNYLKGKEYIIEPIEGELNFYMQMLTGDTSDNIPGIKGIGPKKALNVLASCDTDEDMAEVVWDIYQERGLNKEQYITIGTLLRLKTTEDDTGLWQPPISID